MKKVTAFVGSARRKNTYQATLQFLNNLSTLGEVEYEIVNLTDYKLGICRGCQLCFARGESFCPLKDDRDVLFEKIAASDGVIFATPNYSFQMSGIMKVFLDRFGFAMHRPRYYGKAFTSIVAQGFGGGDKIIEYLDLVANILGFSTVKGTTITGFDPRTEKEQQKADRALADLSKRFYNLLSRPADSAPSLMQLMCFHIGRTTIKQNAVEDSIDYHHWADKGWLESDYYYPTRMSALKKLAGHLMDSLTATMRSVM